MPAEVIEHRVRPREKFDARLAEPIEAHSTDLVVLAGFMRILTDGFVQRFAGRLVNIHPSLLPAFPGLDTHRRALAAGVRVHGATVHFVTAELDRGPIIAQAAVPVLRATDEADARGAGAAAPSTGCYPMRRLAGARAGWCSAMAARRSATCPARAGAVR